MGRASLVRSIHALCDSEAAIISIIIPALNEAAGIRQTIEGLRAALADSPQKHAEILVVDDGSSDETGKIAAAANATVVRHAHNVGYGHALKSGILAARHDTIVIIDADLTYPAEAIPALVAKLGEGFDMVVGARTGHYYEGSVFKGPLRTILKFMVEFSAGRRIPDANSGLRVFRRQTIRSYLPHLCNTFSFTTSLTLAYMLTGRFVTYLPISYHARVGHSKVRLFKDSLRTLQYIVQAIIYYNPLKLFLLMTMLTFATAAVCFVAGALTGLRAPYFLGIGSLVMSILVFSLGLLADLLRQILVRTGGD